LGANINGWALRQALVREDVVELVLVWVLKKDIVPLKGKTLLKNTALHTPCHRGQ
jgi:3-methyladenine DNA glycosylase AlkD